MSRLTVLAVALVAIISTVYAQLEGASVQYTGRSLSGDQQWNIQVPNVVHPASVMKDLSQKMSKIKGKGPYVHRAYVVIPDPPTSATPVAAQKIATFPIPVGTYTNQPYIIDPKDAWALEPVPEPVAKPVDNEEKANAELFTKVAVEDPRFVEVGQKLDKWIELLGNPPNLVDEKLRLQWLKNMLNEYKKLRKQSRTLLFQFDMERMGAGDINAVDGNPALDADLGKMILSKSEAMNLRRRYDSAVSPVVSMAPETEQPSGIKVQIHVLTSPSKKLVVQAPRGDLPGTPVGDAAAGSAPISDPAAAPPPTVEPTVVENLPAAKARRELKRAGVAFDTIKPGPVTSLRNPQSPTVLSKPDKSWDD